MPADPAKMMLGDRDNAKQLEMINEKYHFNKPIYQQYFLYLNDLSPLSFHSEPPIYDSFFPLLTKKGFYCVIKTPYLRTSFYQKNTLNL